MDYTGDVENTDIAKAQNITSDELNDSCDRREF